MSLPAIDTRLSLSGNIGTVRFIGNVDNTSGIWLGIEWDDANRGKHNGVKDGKVYFSCRLPNSGSFIRPTAHGISYGTSFLNALFSRYIELPHGSKSQEIVVLGSSNGAIEVEAVGLDKIRGKISNLERLREVSLEDQLVSQADDAGSIRRTCPNIRGLDMSASLLPSWDEVAMISAELPLLQRLALNRNRLALPANLAAMAVAFLSLTDLHLNGTLISWLELEQVIAFMPKLSLVELGYNHISSLDQSTVVKFATLQSVNLDGNKCIDWAQICNTLHHCPALARLIMTSNLIGTIPMRQKDDPQLLNLNHLSLSSNKLHSWKDIDVLVDWCPSIASLVVIGNPVVEESELAKYSRQFIIAKISTLTALNGTQISAKERNDCELFYLSYIANNIPVGERQEYAQWESLCNKHGSPEHAVVNLGSRSDKLGNRVIDLNLLRCFSTPCGPDDLQRSDATIIRALPTMNLRSFRQKICKTLKCNPRSVNVRLWLKMQDASFVELEENRDQQTLDWLGISQGTDIFCCTQHKE